MSTVKATYLQNASSATVNMTNDTAGNVAVGGTLAMGSSFLRNRIINGDMRIDQRNAGASITPTDGQYSVDRWKASLNVASKFSLQQSTTVPTGFVNSLLATSLSAYTIGAGEVTGIIQIVEGLNISDLDWGLATARTVTLSFWVRSSLTGTFGGSVRNSAANRSYPFTYAINAANTWEQKSVVIPGDTTGTWLTTNGIGINLYFALGAGSTFSGTAGAWAAANYVSATGATSVVGTNGATFYITGVQLEVGSVATPFERRFYANELQLAQRYYYRLPNGTRNMVSGFSRSTTVFRGTIYFPVTMRAAITAVEQNGTAADYEVVQGASDIACSAVVTFQTGTTLTCTVNGTVASGLTAGYAGYLGASAANTAYLAWSAEL